MNKTQIVQVISLHALSTSAKILAVFKILAGERQSARPLATELFVDVHLDGQETRMSSVSNMNVLLMMTARFRRNATTTNAKILVSGCFVELGLNARLSTTKECATALQDCKEIHWFHVLRLDAPAIMIACQPRNVIMWIQPAQRKNASHCAVGKCAPSLLLALRRTTRRFAHVIRLMSETVIHSVTYVRMD